MIDILTRLGTAFRFEDLEAEAVTIEGVRVRVATPETLVRMKRGTMRPSAQTDAGQADAAALARKFGIEER